ncbi:MAG: glycerate kinase [Bacteroidota bacterium]
MKIIIAPDKFKGSLSSAAVCDAIAKGIQQADKNITIHAFPMADGGDGFATVMQYYTKTKTILCLTVDPLGRPIQAAYQWNADTKTAIIELAAASGLVLLEPSERDPMKTSTYGSGLLVKDALGKGAKKIILGIGGSATNDAGTGILSALGFGLLDARNKPVTASGENLISIQKIIPPPVQTPVQFEIACDVENPLYGPQGAAFVYAPQKGATKETVQLLDKGLRHFAALTAAQTNKNLAEQPGTGAAGGIAAGLMPFLNVVLKQGTQLVIEASKIKNDLGAVDIIITGEGKIDQQSKSGKLISSIAALAKQHHIPVIAICGSLQLNEQEVVALGLQKAYSILDESKGLEYAIKNAADLLSKQTARVVASFLVSKKWPA